VVSFVILLVFREFTEFSQIYCGKNNRINPERKGQTRNMEASRMAVAVPACMV
jgi:hypothetical protein